MKNLCEHDPFLRGLRCGLLNGLTTPLWGTLRVTTMQNSLLRVCFCSSHFWGASSFLWVPTFCGHPHFVGYPLIWDYLHNWKCTNSFWNGSSLFGAVICRAKLLISIEKLPNIDVLEFSSGAYWISRKWWEQHQGLGWCEFTRKVLQIVGWHQVNKWSEREQW